MPIMKGRTWAPSVPQTRFTKKTGRCGVADARFTPLGVGRRDQPFGGVPETSVGQWKRERKTVMTLKLNQIVGRVVATGVVAGATLYSLSFLSGYLF